MPVCVSCGVHYRTCKDYDDPFECEDCSSVTDLEDGVEVAPSTDSNHEVQIGDGCFHTLPIFYE